uniref:transposase n=1 Tax=uncultured Microscilla sp. TaxID=432653 RepID=UPI0026361544
QVEKICDLILEATHPHQPLLNKHLISVDEKSGIQALERIITSNNGSQRLEYEYKRHGTTCLMAGMNVANGEISHHQLNDTRNEQDFLSFIKVLIEKYPINDEITIIADNLNTHMSASLTKWVAKQIGFEGDLGEKRGRGILKSMVSRKAFLEDKSHRIRFVFTPRHCSWLNPIENWFSKIQRQLINRTSFTSKSTLCQTIERYINCYNQHWLKPLKWKFKGFTKEKEINIILT